MKHPSLTFSTASFALCLLIASGVHAQPRDVDDLVGARASSGESELEDRGYRYRQTLNLNNSDLSYWWNSRRGSCIAVTVRNGRFDAIATQPEAVCEDSGQASSSSSAPQIRVVDNGNVAVDMGGCNVLFNDRGRIVNQGSSCSRSDVREAEEAYDGYVREQNADAGDEAPPGGFGGGAEFGDTITCESVDNSYQFCRTDVGSNRVRLTNRLSSARCREGDSWGYERDGIWVDNGCRAEFEID